MVFNLPVSFEEPLNYAVRNTPGAVNKDCLWDKVRHIDTQRIVNIYTAGVVQFLPTKSTEEFLGYSKINLPKVLGNKTETGTKWLWNKLLTTKACRTIWFRIDWMWYKIIFDNFETEKQHQLSKYWWSRMLLIFHVNSYSYEATSS